jgi:hypothetical protein
MIVQHFQWMQSTQYLILFIQPVYPWAPKGETLAMTDQTITAIATASVPTVAVLLAYFLNNRNLQDLRADVRVDMQGIRAELLQFRTEVNAKFALIHADVSTLVKVTHELDKRITRLEDAS